jgi:hypothetical protein
VLACAVVTSQVVVALCQRQKALSGAPAHGRRALHAYKAKQHARCSFIQHPRSRRDTRRTARFRAAAPAATPGYVVYNVDVMLFGLHFGLRRCTQTLSTPSTSYCFPSSDYNMEECRQKLQAGSKSPGFNLSHGISASNGLPCSVKCRRYGQVKCGIFESAEVVRAQLRAPLSSGPLQSALGAARLLFFPVLSFSAGGSCTF